MEIKLMDGTAVRPPQQVKAMQILREQKLGLEQSRRVAQETDTVALNEERRAKGLEEELLAARNTLAVSMRRFGGADSGLGTKTAPPDEQKALQALAARATTAEDECFAQQQRAARARATNLAAVRAMEMRERLEVKNEEVARAYEQRMEQEAAARQGRARKVNQQELTAAATLAKNHTKRVEAYEASVSATMQLRNQQETAAREHHVGAVKRVNKTASTTVEALKLLNDKRREDHAHKVESVLSLKANTDAAFAKIKAANARAARRAAAKAAAEAQEFADLTAKGENPYKVFRERDVAAVAAKAEAKAKAEVAKKEASLVRRIVKGDEDGQKRDAVEAHHKRMEQEFRDALGKSVTEARNRAYLMSRTTAGVDMVDPSGREVRPFDPSQVTTIKDHSFGLGFNPRKGAELNADVIRKVSNKHPGLDLGEYQRLLPKPPPPSLADENNSSSGGGGGGDASRLQEMTSPVHAAATPAGLGLTSSAGSLAAAATSDDAGSATGGSGASQNESRRNLLASTKPLSKFELECRAKAQERQRQALIMGAPQTTAGYTFAGKAAFLPKPAIVEFLDFEPGKEYKHKFSLTNTSLTFNSFKLLELPNNVRDFFEVSYDKPGRMSAGTSCSVEVVFRPSANSDIRTALPLLTETGPAEVPIVCCTKKVIPSVVSDHVAFSTVTMGELKTMALVIRNGGALTTSYELIDPDTGALVGDQAPKPQPEIQEDPEQARAVTPGGSLASPSLESAPGSPPKDDDDDDAAAALKAGERSAGVGSGDDGELTMGASQEGVTVIELGSGPDNGDGDGGGSAAAADPAAASPYQSSEAMIAAAAQAEQAEIETDLLAAADRVKTAALSHPPGSSGTLQFASRGTIGAYSETHHAIHFEPLAAGYFLKRIAIRFTGTSEVVEVEISGTAERCPVYVQETVLDLNTVVQGKLYRKALVLCNRGKIAYKVEAQVPPELSDFLEFSPHDGFVQPDVNLELGLKLRPGADLLAACSSVAIATGGRHSVTQVGNFASSTCDVVCLPLQVSVSKQSLPVFFTLKFQVTPGSLALGPPQGLTFGPCYVTERLVQRLQLTNDSRLPQKFGFVHLPPSLEVQPASGFGVLLPMESRAVDVIYKPNEVGPPLDKNTPPLALTLRTSLGATYRVPCDGVGVAPPLDLSATVLQLVPCALGSFTTASCMVSNPSRTRVTTFHFVVPCPELSRLHVSPAVATLQPGETIRVEVRFNAQAPPPTRAELEEKVAAKRVARLAAVQEAAAVAAAAAADDESSVGTAASGASSKKGKNAAPAGKKGDKGGKKGGAKPDPAAEAAAEEAKAAAQARAEEEAAAEEAKELAVMCLDDLAEHVGSITRSGSSGSEGSSDEEPWSVHAKFHIPCYARMVPVEGIASSSGSAGDSNLKQLQLGRATTDMATTAAAQSLAGTQALNGDMVLDNGEVINLQEYCQPQFLTVVSTVVTQVLEGDATSLDFGELAVGQVKTIMLRLTNHGEAPLNLASSGLNGAGSFSIRNALREIRGGGSYITAQVQFAPDAQGVRQEELLLHDSQLGVSLRVPLKGKGVSPLLEVLDPPEGILDCGHCLEGDSISLAVTLHNASHFALGFKLEPLDAPPPNFNNRPPFTLSPSEATVGPGEDLSVKVTFAPDLARAWPYHQDLKVAVPSQQKEPQLKLSGHCHARQLYVASVGANSSDSANHALELREDPLLLAPSALHRVLDPKASSALFGERPPEAPCIKLTFPREAPKNSSSSGEAQGGGGGPSPLSVEVGCCVLERYLGSSSGGSYSVDFEASNKYFACSDPTGNVAPGERKVVNFTFTPPAVVETYGLDVGQWARTTAKINLTGGFHHPHADLSPVHVVLEGYIQI